jgi:hypothetical protein
VATRSASLIAVLVLAGCTCQPETITKTITVEKPIQIRDEPPPELAAPLALQAPTFVSPSDAGATSALTPQGERELKELLDALLGRVEQWEAYGLGR